MASQNSLIYAIDETNKIKAVHCNNNGNLTVGVADYNNSGNTLNINSDGSINANINNVDILPTNSTITSNNNGIVTDSVLFGTKTNGDIIPIEITDDKKIKVESNLITGFALDTTLTSTNTKLDTINTTITNKNLSKLTDSVDISGQTINVNTISGFALDTTLTSTNTKLDTINTTITNKHLSKLNDSVDISGQTVDISGQTINVNTISGFALDTTLTSTNTKLDTIHGDLDTTIHNDITTTNSKLDTLHTDLDTTINNNLTTISTKLDTVDGEIVTTNSKLDTIHEDLNTTIHGDLIFTNIKLDTIHGDLDTTIHNDITSTNTKLDTLHTDLDGLTFTNNDLNVHFSNTYITAKISDIAGVGIGSTNNALNIYSTSNSISDANFIRISDGVNQVPLATNQDGNYGLSTYVINNTPADATFTKISDGFNMAGITNNALDVNVNNLSDLATEVTLADIKSKTNSLSFTGPDLNININSSTVNLATEPTLFDIKSKTDNITFDISNNLNVNVNNQITGFALDTTLTSTNTKLDTINTTITNKHIDASTDSITIYGSDGVDTIILKTDNLGKLQVDSTVSNDNTHPLYVVPTSDYVSYNTNKCSLYDSSGSILSTSTPITSKNCVDVGSYLYAKDSSTTVAPLTTTLDGSNQALDVHVANSSIAVTGTVTSKLQDNSGNALNSTSNALNSYITNTSIPVTGSFWQTTQPVSGTVTSKLQDGSGTAITSTLDSAKQALDVHVANSSIPVTGTFYQATQPVSGTVTSKLQDNSGNALTSTGGALDVNVASGSITVGSVDIKDSAGNNITALTSGATGALKNVLYDASGNTVTTSAPATSVRSLDTAASLYAKDATNSRALITTTLDSASQALDVHVANGSTTNLNNISGLNIYQIYPKKKSFIWNGRTTDNLNNDTILAGINGNVAAGQNLGYNSFSFGKTPQVFYAQGNTNSLNLLYSYVDSSCNLVPNVSLPLTTASNTYSLAGGAAIFCVLKFEIIESNNSANCSIYYSSTTNVTTRVGFWSSNNYWNGLIMVPNGWVGRITNLYLYSVVSQQFLIYKYNNRNYFKQIMATYNGITNSIVPVGGDSIGGIIEAGELVLISRTTMTTETQFSGCITMEQVS